MNKKQLIIIFSLSAVALILVLITQLSWAVNAYHQNKKEIKASVGTAMSVAAQKTRNRSACFELFSKAYIKKGEGFFLSKLNANEKNDTLPMLFNGHGIDYDRLNKTLLLKYNRIDFSIPVTAEIVVSFHYQMDDSLFSKISQDSVFKKLNPVNYQEVLSGNINVTRLYDTTYLDSTLRSELLKQSVDMPYSLGIIDWGNKKVVYKTHSGTDAALLQSEYIADLNGDEYFNKQYKIALAFKRQYIVGKTLWIMLLISSFVILLLVTLMWQFIRVINRQRKVNDMKNDFINNMTHEFNTPIANIALAAESLTKADDLQKDEKTARLVSIIQEQNENIRGNVEHILKMALNEKQGMQLNKEQLNLQEVIKSVIYEFNLVLAEKGGSIIFAEPAEPVYIYADELYLLHVLQNLIDNAIKYNHHKPVITISIFADNEKFVIITVEDNGIGMSKEELKYIFDKFYRVPTGNIHHAKGFGLGLNYVQSIVTAHGGSVNVKSIPGKGSTFELYIPKNQST